MFFVSEGFLVQPEPYANPHGKLEGSTHTDEQQRAVPDEG